MSPRLMLSRAGSKRWFRCDTTTSAASAAFAIMTRPNAAISRIMPLPPSVQQPGRSGGLGDLPYLVHQTGTDRDAFRHALGGVVPLRIAGDHDRLSRIDRLCRPQIIGEPADIGGEFHRFAEQFRVDGDKAPAHT